MTTEEQALQLRLHLERLTVCLSEAIDFATRTAPGGEHNAGMWAAAVNEACQALTGAPDAPQLRNEHAPRVALPPAPYTPGPWRLDRGQLRDRDGNSLASVPYTLGGPEDHGNGRLILAAPDLADGARALLERLDNLTTWSFGRGGERAERERLRAILTGILGEVTP